MSAIWTPSPDGMMEWAETSDPRVVVVVQQDTDASGPDGDALAPAYWIEYRDGWRSQGQAGATFDDSDAIERYLDARNRVPWDSTNHRPAMDSHEFATRYMRAFHDTTIETVESRVSRSEGTIVLLNTPAYRVHVGIDGTDGARTLNGAGEPIADEIALSLTGEREEFQAWLDGDVYGVGWAILPERVTTETEIDPALDGWDVTMECWGFYGLTYAQTSAEEMEHGGPELPEMLPITEEASA